MILDDPRAQRLAIIAANPRFHWSHEEREALMAGATAIEAQARHRRSTDSTRPTKLGEPGDGA